METGQRSAQIEGLGLSTVCAGMDQIDRAVTRQPLVTPGSCKRETQPQRRMDKTSGTVVVKLLLLVRS